MPVSPDRPRRSARPDPSPRSARATTVGAHSLTVADPTTTCAARSATLASGAGPLTVGFALLVSALFAAFLSALALSVAPLSAAEGPPSGGTSSGIAALQTSVDTVSHVADRSILRVSAQSQVEVAPDRARISFAVETQAETARDAGEANGRLMDEVLSVVQATEVEGLRTETSGYSLTPRYQTTRSDMPRVIVGYTALNHLLVTVDDVDEVGRLLDLALEAGANRVAGLQFLVQDAEPHRQEALRRAITLARTEAETVAAALGVRLGAPLDVEAGSSRPSMGPSMQFARAEMMAMADAPTTPVEAGLQTVSANVTIQYRIHP